jgi:hypothetical protein
MSDVTTNRFLVVVVARVASRCLWATSHDRLSRLCERGRNLHVRYNDELSSIQRYRSRIRATTYHITLSTYICVFWTSSFSGGTLSRKWLLSV